MWIGANGSTAAYAIVVTPSWALFVVGIFNALGCAAVVVLTAWKRHRLAVAGAVLSAGRINACIIAVIVCIGSISDDPPDVP